MKLALFLLSGLILAGCAATSGPRFTVSAPGWEQPTQPIVGPDGSSPLLGLRHPTGAEITVDAYKLDGKTVTQMAELVHDRLSAVGVTCGAIEDLRRACGGHSPGDHKDDVRVSSFITALYDSQGRLWSGKISVARVRGAPADVVFVFAGRWLAEDRIQATTSFDDIVDDAKVE